MSRCYAAQHAMPIRDTPSAVITLVPRAVLPGYLLWIDGDHRGITSVVAQRDKQPVMLEITAHVLHVHVRYRGSAWTRRRTSNPVAGVSFPGTDRDRVRTAPRLREPTRFR
jgi:hypothetical protein